MAALAIVKTGLMPAEVQNFGLKFTPTDQSILLIMLAGVVGYFWFVFILYATIDWLAVMWALHTSNIELQHELLLGELRRQERVPGGGITPKAPESSETPFKFRRLASGIV